MKKKLLILLLPLFIGCGHDTNKNNSIEEKNLVRDVSNNKDTSMSFRDKIKFENIDVGYSEPIAFASTNNIAIPLMLREKYIEKSETENHFYNIIVFSPSDSIGKLVFQESSIITKITTFEKSIVVNDYKHYYYEENNKLFSEIFNSLLFIEKKVNEFNVLYVYDLNHDILKQLSPYNYNLVSWYPLNGKTLIIMNCQLDDNNNGYFDKKDNERIFTIDFKNGVSSIEKKINISALKEIKGKLNEDKY